MSEAYASVFKTNSKVAHKKSPSANVQYFLIGALDPPKYKIVDVSTQYVFTYKNKQTGKKTSVIKKNYLNLETLDFQFHRMVYGTKQFYMRVRTGNLKQIMVDLTKNYAKNIKVDAQLNYESNVFACIIGAIVFSFLFMVFCWIVRKLLNPIFGNCCVTKTKTVKFLDVDIMNNRKDWNLNDMSVKKEFKGDQMSEDLYLHIMSCLEKQ